MPPACFYKVSSQASDNLIEAARQGHYKRAVEAVSEGATLDARTLRNETALMLASSSNNKGSVETIIFLIETMAELESRDDQGWTPLMHACRNSQRDAAGVLLQKGASVKVRGMDGKTATMLATMDGADSLVADLVGAQASIDKRDDQGWPVLYFACQDGRQDLVKWLLRRGANAKDKAKDGCTALMIAAQSGHVKIGERLLKKNANLNLSCLSGDTALTFCLRHQHEEFADWLLDEGVDIPPKTEGEEDCLDIAEALGMNALRGRMEVKLRQNQDGVV